MNEMGRSIWLSATLLCATLAAGLWACDQTACGPGTVEVEGDCMPLQPANCSGPGVRFVNGRCVPDFDEVCGPGTLLSEDGTSCISLGGGGDPAPDVGPDAVPDALGELGDDIDLADEEVVEFEPICGDDLDPAGDAEAEPPVAPRICLWGRVFDFISGDPVPADADPPLQVQVKDLIEALGDPLALLDETLIEPGGYFLLPSVEMTNFPPAQLILIVGEDEEGGELEGLGETWQRTISGLVTTNSTVDEIDDLTLFVIERSAVTDWNDELGISPPVPGIEVDGFLLVRVVDVETGDPIEGASLVYQGAADVTLDYFTDAALTTLGGTETGPGGVAMLRGSEQTDQCSGEADGYSAVRSINCGVAEGRATINILQMAED